MALKKALPPLALLKVSILRAMILSGVREGVRS
jgi:hypothetical protein